MLQQKLFRITEEIRALQPGEFYEDLTPLVLPLFCGDSSGTKARLLKVWAYSRSNGGGLVGADKLTVKTAGPQQAQA